MEKTIVQITSELEMLGFIKTNGTQCRFVAIVTKTPVVKIRVGNPWGAGKSKDGLYKVSRKMGIINANYNTSVRRRLAANLGVELAEVEYTNGEVWYKHLSTVDGKALPVVVHAKKETGEHYLQYFPQKSSSAYVNEAGEVVADIDVESWLYAEKEREEYKPAVIAVNLKNVKEIRASGVIMEAADLEDAEKILSAV